MLLQFESSSNYTPLIEKLFPDFVASEKFQAFRQFILSKVFDNAIDIIIVLNTLVVVVQSWPSISGQSVPENAKDFDSAVDTSWEIVESVFTCVYVIEMASKLIVCKCV